MIVIRKTKNKEENIKIEQMINDYSFSNNINSSSIFFVLEDKGEIKGGCNFQIANRYVIINFLVIDKDRRGENLGDGLLRSVLNYCSKNDVEKAYFIGDSNYLLKKGFSRVEGDINEATVPIIRENIKNILECDVEDFFSKGCCCKRS